MAKWKELAILVVLILIGALLRFYALDQYPPGLYRDEAYNGLDALGVLQGERSVFFEANNGREPLFIYFLAASVELFGRTSLAIRIVAAILGTLTIVAAFLMARAFFGSRLGLLTAAVTAGTFWMVNLSRLGLRAVALPLFLALAFWQLWEGIRSKRLFHFVVAGVLWGLSFYTYLAARFTIILFLAWAVYLLITRQSFLSRRQGMVFILAAGATALPLAFYFLTHWELTIERSFEVSIFNPQIHQGDFWGTLASNVQGVLFMFNFRGDFIPRHNLPLRPVFDPILGIFFAGGLVLALRRFRESPEHAFLVIWLLIMLLPTLLAEGAPHFLRGVGILPGVLIFPALGLDAVRRLLESRQQPLPAILGIAGVLTISTTWTGVDYFLGHAPSEAVYYNFETGATELAGLINDALTEPDSEPIVYLAPRLWETFPSIRFLVLPSQKFIILGPTVQPSAQPKTTLLIVWPFEDNRAYLRLLPTNSWIIVREGAYERGDLETQARLLYLTYFGIPAPELSLDSRPRFGDSFVLLDSIVGLEDNRLYLYFLWYALEEPEKDYIVFVHILRGAEIIAQGDGPPAQGYYPTSLWRPGDIVADERFIQLPEPIPGWQLRVKVGFYLLETQERLPAFDFTGQPVGDGLTLDVE